MPPPAGAGRCWYCAAKFTPDRGANALERLERLARRIERFAGRAAERKGPARRLDRMRLVVLGDGRERGDLPAALGKNVAGEIILVQALHDDDDRALFLVVEPRIEGRIEPVVGGGAAALRHRVDGFERVVDQDHIGAAAGEDAADRGREAEASGRRRELGERRAGRGEPGLKQLLVPVRGHDLPAVAGEFLRQVLGVGDVDDGEARVMAEEPRRQRDRGGERFQVPRRHVDDEPLHGARLHALELRRQDFGVPCRNEGLAAVQLGEGAHQEGIEILPDRRPQLGERNHVRRRLRFKARAFVCLRRAQSEKGARHGQAGRRERRRTSSAMTSALPS